MDSLSHLFKQFIVQQMFWRRVAIEYLYDKIVFYLSSFFWFVTCCQFKILELKHLEKIPTCIWRAPYIQISIVYLKRTLNDIFFLPLWILGGTLNVKFEIYMCQMTILKGVLNNFRTYFLSSYYYYLIF
jgi:hypothetical protein